MVFGISPHEVKSGLLTVNDASPFFCDGISAHTLLGVTGGSPTHAAPPVPALPLLPAVLPPAPALELVPAALVPPLPVPVGLSDEQPTMAVAPSNAPPAA